MKLILIVILLLQTLSTYRVSDKSLFKSSLLAKTKIALQQLQNSQIKLIPEYDSSNLSAYHGGSRVKVNGKIYECMNWPSSPWCGILAYKPGEPTQFWKAAWKQIANAQKEGDQKNDGELDSNQKGQQKQDEGMNQKLDYKVAEYDQSKVKSYRAGTQVRVNGKVYQCKDGAVAGWCSLTVYKPGQASGFWKDAWDEKKVINEAERQDNKDQSSNQGQQGQANSQANKDQSNNQGQQGQANSGDKSQANKDQSNNQGQQGQANSGDSSQPNINSDPSIQEYNQSKLKQYKAGSKVRVNGKIYQCKEGIVAGWCTLSSYKPGQASEYWKDAWIDLSQPHVKPNINNDVQESDSNKDKEKEKKENKNNKQKKQKIKYYKKNGFISLYPSQEDVDFSKLKKIGEDVYLDEKTKQISLSGKVKRLVDAATAYPGEPQIDFKNPSNNPQNVQRVMKIISQPDWNYIFEVADKIYTYSDFLKAVAKFRHFCAEKGPYTSLSLDDVCKKELATVFAHANQQTGAHTPPAHMRGVDQWRQGLYFVRQVACVHGGCGYRGGCQGWAGKAWPCPEGVQYYGRGMKQISYNYNYGPFSQAMFQDVNVLLRDPDRVAREGWLAVSSAIWFYMKPQSPKPSMHDVVAGFWKPSEGDLKSGIQSGFGATINIINGGLECNKPSKQADNRVKYYQQFLKYFRLQNPANEVMDCRNQRQFPANSSGAMSINWEQNWSKSGECKLVTYQRPYTLFGGPNDYKKCVELYFPNSI